MKNTKLIFHRCGVFFTVITLTLLFVLYSAESNLYYQFGHAASIFVWALFFGASFVVFDIKKIPPIIARTIHFTANGVGVFVWIYHISTSANQQENSRLFQIVFFGIFVYVVVYWVLHYASLGINALFKYLMRDSSVDKKSHN